MQTGLSIPHAGIAPATRTAGFEPRFHFWVGASGRRYLFTQTSVDALAHYSEVVVLLAERQSNGQLIGRAVETIGRAGPGEQLLRSLSEDRRLVAFVHFLATSTGARLSIAADLTGRDCRLAA